MQQHLLIDGCKGIWDLEDQQLLKRHIDELSHTTDEEKLSASHGRDWEGWGRSHG